MDLSVYSFETSKKILFFFFQNYSKTFLKHGSAIPNLAFPLNPYSFVIL